MHLFEALAYKILNFAGVSPEPLFNLQTSKIFISQLRMPDTMMLLALKKISLPMIKF